jgi:sec-independent protein translocase protein TatA
MLPNIGPLELTIILLIVIIIFGARRLPELGRSLGKGIKEFQAAIKRNNYEETSAKNKNNDDK